MNVTADQYKKGFKAAMGISRRFFMPLVGLTIIWLVIFLSTTGCALIPDSTVRNILLLPIVILVVMLLALIAWPYLFGIVFGAKKLENPKLEAFTEVKRSFGLKGGEAWVISGDQIIAMLTGIWALNARIFLNEYLLNSRSFTKRERQAVFAHELAHVKKRHRLKKFILALAAITIILSINGFVERTVTSLSFLNITVLIDIAGYVLLILMYMYFSRKCEFEADLTAAQTGYRKGLISFFDKLGYRNAQIYRPSRISLLFTSHPDHIDRKDHLLKI